MSAVEAGQHLPLVSVVIAAYHAENTLARAIDSLVAQTVRNWEAIVVDDASADRTVEIAEELAARDHRIRVIRMERNGGPAAARNKGMKSARGQWIATLDSDDVYVPTRLEKLLAVASGDSWDLLFDNIGTLSKKGGAERPYWPRWQGMRRAIPLAEMLRGCSGAMKNTYGVLKPFVKRSFVEKLDLYYDTELKRGEDVLFHISLMLKGARTARVTEIGYLYEIPDAANRVSASVTNLQHSHMATLKIRDAGWAKMILAEKMWWKIRFLNTAQPELWKSFRYSLKERNLLVSAKIALYNPAILAKLVIAKPLKIVVSVFA